MFASASRGINSAALRYRWLSYARRRALPVCGPDNPRRTKLYTLQDLKMRRRTRRDGLRGAVMSEVNFTTHALTAFCRFHARTSALAPGKTRRIVTTAARIVAMTAATPQEWAAAAVPHTCCDDIVGASSRRGQCAMEQKLATDLKALNRSEDAGQFSRQ